MAIGRFVTKGAALGTGGQVLWTLSADGTHWEARTEGDIVEDLRPTVNKWQLIQACSDFGITEAQLEVAVAALSAKRQRFWKYTTILDRDNPFSAALRSSLSPQPTPGQWSAIFRAAAELDFLKV